MMSKMTAPMTSAQRAHAATALWKNASQTRNGISGGDDEDDAEPMLAISLPHP
jgi:hypothetical protein